MWILKKTEAINTDHLLFLRISSDKYVDTWFYVKGALTPNIDTKDHLTIAGAFSKETDAKRVFNRIIDGIREDVAFIELAEEEEQNTL